jgi:hypothetical protein
VYHLQISSEHDYYHGYYEVHGTLTPPSGAGVPTVATTELPPATVGVFYSAQIATLGGATAYYSSELPAGLTLNNTTGVISGTPLAAGIFDGTAGNRPKIAFYAANAIGMGGNTEVILTIAKGTPVFVGSVFDAPSVALTSDLLRAAFRAPGDSLGVAPDFTRVTFTVPHPHTPNTTLNAIGTSFNRFGPAVVTATFLGDQNYNAITLVATFTAVDTQPPQAPTALQQNVLGSTSVGLQWAPAIDNFLVKRYEIDVGDGRARLKTRDATLQSQSTATNMVVNGLLAGTAYTIKVYAVDFFDLVSPAGQITVTTAATPPPTTTLSRFRDINNDGIKDELIPGNTPNAFYYDVAEISTQTVTYESWTWDFQADVGIDLGETRNFFAAGWWVPVVDYDTTTINTVRPYFQYLAEDGYDYRLVREVTDPRTGQPTTNVYSIYRDSWLAGVSISGMREWMPDSFWPEDAFFAGPTFLARVGKPIGGVSLPGSSFGVTVGTSRGLGGLLSIPFPGTGKVVISVKDVIGQVLKAGPSVVWQVWDGINQIRVGSTTVGDLIDLGINTSGQFQVGLKLDDSTTVWLNVSVQAPPQPKLAVDANRDGAITSTRRMARRRLRPIDFGSTTMMTKGSCAHGRPGAPTRRMSRTTKRSRVTQTRTATISSSTPNGIWRT